MNLVKKYGIILLVFTLVWVILNEKAGPSIWLSGMVFSAVALFVTDFFLLEDPYADLYSLHPVTLIQYLLYLIFQIYRSGFSAIIKIINGHKNVQIKEYVSSLNDDLAISLLANSITLTPGTVTLEKKRNVLKVLSFEESDPEKMKKLDFSEFERILKGLRA